MFEPATEAQLVEFQRSFIPVVPGEPQTNIPPAVVVTPPAPGPAKEKPSAADLIKENNKQNSSKSEEDQNPEPEEVVDPPETPSRNPRSRCPKCGRVKSKKAELCEQCTNDTE